jgi:hypothetical protein
VALNSHAGTDARACDCSEQSRAHLTSVVFHELHTQKSYFWLFLTLSSPLNLGMQNEIFLEPWLNSYTMTVQDINMHVTVENSHMHV